MSCLLPGRATDPIAPTGEPHSAVIGMTVDDARRYLAAHSLTLVVFRRNGAEVPDADLRVRGGVLVTVRASEVVEVNGRT